jgi:seryl-tRNA synthetase
LSTPEQFRDQLLGAGLLVDGGVPGVYHRSFRYEAVVRSVQAYVTAPAEGESYLQLSFPPVQARSTLEVSGYISSFPNLVGLVSSFAGTEAEVSALLAASDDGVDWAGRMTPTDVSLCSAACHGLYPMLAGSTLPTEGRRFEVHAWCFRHEPSSDPARMQSFRMHEFVYVGTPRGAEAHREAWIPRATELLEELGLAIDVVPANDPFFGRAGRLLASNQRTKQLKFELVTPISSEAPGAISSGNVHEDHFGAAFDLRADGDAAHSACFAFGLDRIALALLYRHGLDEGSWPADVQRRLKMDVDAGAPAIT